MAADNLVGLTDTDNDNVYSHPYSIQWYWLYPLKKEEPDLGSEVKVTEEGIRRSLPEFGIVWQKYSDLK